MSPEPSVSRAKAPPAKRSEKGYGDENGHAHEPVACSRLSVSGARFARAVLLSSRAPLTESLEQANERSVRRLGTKPLHAPAFPAAG